MRLCRAATCPCPIFLSEASGNSFATTSKGDTSPGSLNEYCVSGNTLNVKIVDGTKTTILIGSK
jgi:hypothetical protein